jgi:hypothetical protein
MAVPKEMRSVAASDQAYNAHQHQHTSQRRSFHSNEVGYQGVADLGTDQRTARSKLRSASQIIRTEMGKLPHLQVLGASGTSRRLKI